MAEPRWPWFLAWSVPGALAGMAVAGAASIGLFLAPLAALSGVWVARRAPGRADAWGLALGLAIAAATLGVINLDYYEGTCPERDNVSRLPGGSTRVEGCGGFDPVPFFVAAGAFAAVALAAYAWAGRRRG